MWWVCWPRRSRSASAGAFAQDRYDQNRYDDGSLRAIVRRRYEDGDGAYDYARVVDVQPLITRVRVSTPQRECWDETRYDERGYGNGPLPRSSAGGAVLGARHRCASSATRSVTATVAMRPPRRAPSSARRVGSQQAQRRAAYAVGAAAANTPCSVARRATTMSGEERTDGYRVTYVYNGRRQVTELPYRPGERIRVRVDVSPAE